MLVQVLDATAQPHYVAMQGQDQINDYSGTLPAAAVGPAAAPQIVAAINANRAGFLFQNTSANPMLFIEVQALGVASSWLIMPGKFFPPLPNYPIPTGEFLVQGTAASQLGDTFTLRDWQTGAGE